MARFVVIREKNAAAERLVKEGAIPEEAVLHKELMNHPELVPATDLGLGQVAAVGFEADLASGFADLVLLDDHGRLCIVEVKKEGNPDTRKVVAQLLDYAAALWGLTLEEFEQNVVLDQDGNRMELRELIQEKLLPTDTEDPESATEELLEDLRKTLRTGDFELVVAAPTIPEGVQRVMEYLNNRGQRLFGLEVSYFTDEADIEVFVPRLVVRPIPQTEPSSEPVDQETYLQSLPEHARAAAESFLARAVADGRRIKWLVTGPRVRVKGKVIVILADYLWVKVGELKGIPRGPGLKAAQRLKEVGAQPEDDGWFWIEWEGNTPDQIEAVLRIGEDLVAELSQALESERQDAS